MALSNSLLAYDDCQQFFEKAVEDPKGARRPFPTEDQAIRWRMRCHQFRKLHREQNAAVYPLGELLHGRSEYDVFTLTIKYSPDGYHWVYAERVTLEPGEIEGLSEVPELAQEERMLLEDHSDETDQAADI